MFLNFALARLSAGLFTDVLNFMPELILCATIVLLLLLRLFRRLDRAHLGVLSMLCTLAALAVSWHQWESIQQPTEMFSGLLVFDRFTIFLRLFLMGFAALLIWLSLLTGIPDREDSADFYCLLLGATLGMSIMASSNHLLMVFIGIEMASLPSYALAGFLKGRRQSSEAALKYVVYGGGTAGVMLYGISLIVGHQAISSGYLPTVVQAIGTVQPSGSTLIS